MPRGVMQALHARQTAPMANRGTVMNIVSWMLLAIVVCTLIARFAMKLSMKTRKRKLGLDDLFIGLAALFSFLQTVAVSIESMKVLGQHVHDLTAEQLDVYQKAEYGACMLYIANMGCSRISVCLLIRKILPGVVPKYTALVFAGFTSIWMVSGIIVTAFACGLPHPWKFLENTKCYNAIAFVNYLAVTNIVVEVLLVAIPLVVWNVRISTRRQASVSLVFLARLSVVAAISVQLHFFNRADLADFSYNCWPVILSQQIAQNLAVISACLPCLHPFIINILDGTIEPTTIQYKCRLKYYVERNTPMFEATSLRSSRASITPLTEKTTEPYCRPLATYDLDRSSAHRHTHSASHFPSNIAKPVFNPRPPENVFNRLIEVPLQSRPATSTSATDPLAPPRNLRDVGVLPNLDWDTESSNSSGSRKGSPARHPTSEYLFNRQQVISVPEEHSLYDKETKRYAPPLPSPRWPKRPPRAF